MNNIIEIFWIILGLIMLGFTKLWEGAKDLGFWGTVGFIFFIYLCVKFDLLCERVKNLQNIIEDKEVVPKFHTIDDIYRKLDSDIYSLHEIHDRVADVERSVDNITDKVDEMASKVDDIADKLDV
jgi:hypothetical protein